MFGALLFALVASSIGAKPEFRTPFENVTLKAGKEWLYLVCKAEGERPMTYKWYNQDEDEMTEDYKLPVYVVGWGNDSALVFKNVSNEHESSYTCIASNAHGLASKVFSLRVPPPNGTKPEFRTPFENVTIAAGRYRILLCRAEGERPMTYKWYNQGKDEMTQDDKQPVFVRKWDNASSLVFRNVSSEHEGSYTCTASNAHGLASKMFFLTVVPPQNGTKPEFRTPFENVTMAAGRYTILLCRAEGEKPMTYKWYNQGGDEMTGDDKQLMVFRKWGSDSSLVFRNLSSEHEGSYTCTASNAHGLASKVFFLTVLHPNDGNDTDIDRGNGTSLFRDAKVLKYTTRSVTFYITTSGPVKYIEAKYREGKRASNATTIRLNPAPGNKSYVIGNLFPGGFYIFQFRTVPSESNKWSRNYNVTLLPDTPEIILEMAYNQSVKLQWFMKTDDVLRGTIDRHQIKYFPVEMVGGSSWTSRNCSVTTEVPICVGSSYTIWGLERTIFYQIEVRAHTEAGYGEPWRQKVYLP